MEFALLQAGIPYADLKVMSEEDVWAYFHIDEFLAERRQAELDALRR